MCAVLFGALFISNAFANTGDVVANTVDAAAVTTTGEAAAEATTGEAVAAETTTGTVAAEATTGDVTTGAVATTGDVATGAVATGAVAAEATTGDVATGSVATTGEAEVSINDTLHAILDKYFEDNASKFNTAKDRKDFFETVKANINKAAEKAKEAQKEAFEIIKGALETYEIK
jgi:sugar (pentulose or hexulose) kinase